MQGLSKKIVSETFWKSAKAIFRLFITNGKAISNILDF